MNRIVAAVMLLILSIGTGIAGYFSVLSYVKETRILMEKDRDITVSTAVSDIERAKEIQELWEKKQGLLATLLPHDELEEIEIGIMSLTDFNSQGMTEEYVKTLNNCINRLNHIEETEKPTLKNIL